MHNNNEGKKQQVEDHHKNFKFPNNKTSVTACNDSLNTKTLTVNFIYVTCGKCVLNDNPDMCVLYYIDGVNSRTKMPMAVPISTREPKQTVNQSTATPLKRTVAVESTNQKCRNTIRKQYEQISKTCKRLYCKITPPGYKWKPNSTTVNVEPNLVEIILFIINSRCSKHMTGDLNLLSNFVEQFLGTVKFGYDQIAPILGYEDPGTDLLTGSCGTDLYSLTLQDTSTPNPICLMAKATSSQAWLWHHCLSHINFDTINLLSKYDIVTGLPKLKFIKDYLCSSYELGKAKRKYTWTHFLRSKDEIPEVLIDFIKLVQRGLHAQVRTIRTDKDKKFLNKILHAYFAQEGIAHQTSTAQTLEQNGVVKRWNRTLIKAARTMLNVAKVPLFLWAESIATSCFTQNRSLLIPRHEKTPYHIINGRKSSVKLFNIFGSLCYIIKDGENLDKMKEKGNACIFVGYSTQQELIGSDPVPQYLTTALEQGSLSLGPQSQENVPQTADTVTTSNELDLDIPPLNNQTTTETTSQAPTVTANQNIIQAKTNKEHAQVDEDKFINIFSTPVQEQGETSSRYVDSSNMHTFYQRHPSRHHWTKYHPLEQVIGNPSQSIRTRRQLETDGEMCIDAGRIHQFDRLDVWELVDRPLYKNVINMKWLWKNKRDEENTIFTRHRFSPNKTSVVYEKTSPRSDLRWKRTGRIFKIVGLRWVPTGKIFTSCTSKADSEPTHGSNSWKVYSIISSTNNSNGENKVISKSFAVPTSDASDKCQQQPDSTSSTASTSTLATTVTAYGNFDL
ncbi:retrovirus-related pol polyprotein from transposon TNT 1-94 [Tanacetum coccineum]